MEWKENTQTKKKNNVNKTIKELTTPSHEMVARQCKESHTNAHTYTFSNYKCYTVVRSFILYVCACGMKEKKMVKNHGKNTHTHYVYLLIHTKQLYVVWMCIYGIWK